MQSTLHASGKGRGLVVTEEVKAGQLLLVNNPLAVAKVEANQDGLQIDWLAGEMVSCLQL